jgi:GAF domain-containing protein
MGNDGWSSLLRWWGPTVVAALCAGAAFIAQVEAGENLSAWASWVIKLGGAGATVVALILPARQTWAEVRAREAAEQIAKAEVTTYQLAVRSVLLPLTDIFDRIITAPNKIGRMEAKGAAKQAVVNSVVQLSRVSGARSCYFEYEHGSKEGRLVCTIYAGRDSKPRTVFSSANPNHTEVFQLLESRQSELREDTNTVDPPRFPLDRLYKTYISVPVATSAEVFGLLTLDALHAGELKQQHEREMLLLAQLLGIALANDGSSRSDTNNMIRPGKQYFVRLVHSVTRRGNNIA